MARFNRLSRIACIAALAGIANAPPLGARTKKGDKDVALSRQAEQRKEWDKALSFAEEALSEDPADIGYQLTATRMRFYDSQFHIAEGRKLRDQGKLDEALAEFQKAYGVNPASAMAEEEIRRTRQMIEREKNKPAQNAEDRGLTAAQLEKQEEAKRIAAMEPIPEL